MKDSLVSVQRQKLEDAYGILCQGLAKVGIDPFRTPFGMTYCVIPVGSASSPHRHYDGEFFFVISGEGQMTIATDIFPVKSLDLIRIKNHQEHVLKNISSLQELHFVSVYWDQPAVVPSGIAARTLILPAPPTPNGKLHVGHLSGPYLASDVMRRFLRLKGSDAITACGTDENQTYVPYKGVQENRSPQSVMTDYGNTIQSILGSFQAMPDRFLMPHKDLEYQAFVQEFFLQLKSSGKIFLKKTKAPWSTQLNKFVHEAYVSGKCPHCQAPTNANGCEACGLYNDGGDLMEPQCNLTGGPIELREVEKYYFPLKNSKVFLQESLKGKYFSTAMEIYIDRMLTEGLQDISVTFPGDWGVPAPGVQGQVIYEWFEMAAAYLYHAKKVSVSGAAAEFWSKDSANQVILTFGFDNSFFYLGFVPALIQAFDSSFKFPDGFLINQFYLLDGKKFSTSRRHAIWGDEILKDSSVSDALRFYLVRERPEEMSTDFRLRNFETWLARLSEDWEGLLGQFFHSLKNQKAPFLSCRTQQTLDPRSRVYLRGLERSLSDFEIALSVGSFSLPRAAQALEHCFAHWKSFFVEWSQLQNSQKFEQLWREKQLLLLMGLDVLAMEMESLSPGWASDLRKSFGISKAQRWISLLDIPQKREIVLGTPPRFLSQSVAGLKVFLETDSARKYL